MKTKYYVYYINTAEDRIGDVSGFEEFEGKDLALEFIKGHIGYKNGFYTYRLVEGVELSIDS